MRSRYHQEHEDTKKEEESGGECVREDVTGLAPCALIRAAGASQRTSTLRTIRGNTSLGLRQVL